MADSKRDILTSIRRHLPEPINRPDLGDADWITYADRQEQFVQMLAAVGGEAKQLASLEQLQAELQQLPACREAKQVYSVFPEACRSTVDLGQIHNPHDLQDVDFAVLPGQFAVAENAAVWVRADSLHERALYFIVQHLALVVPADEIVDNMHQAYQRLSFENAGFGVFISGPSKTADIEQSLVIGAHGPRSLTVFLLEPKETTKDTNTEYTEDTK